MDNKYQNLENLLSGTFYQCWADYDDRSADEKIDEVINLSKETELMGAIDELNQMFEEIGIKNNLEKLILWGIGCEYDSKSDGKSNIEWLVEIKQKIQSHLSVEADD